jgi:ABC-2 type transport system permease protein
VSAQAGAGRLARLAVRRDRWVLPVWLVLLAVYTVSLVRSIDQLYPTEADRLEFIADTAGTGSYEALFGPPHASNLGALGAQRATSVLLIVAVISLLVAIRHTRTEEEAGRRELLAALPVGRQAPVTAVVAVLFGADLLLGLLVAAGMRSLAPGSGALALGLEVTLAGWMWAALGLLLAQVTAGARTARGIGLTVLGAAYLLRMAGDAGSASWLGWLSPIGWLQRVQAYGDQRWWAFLPALALVAVLLAGAYRLAGRRDLGAGLLPPRPGPARAGARLAGPLGLAWRLQRGLLVGWTAAMAVVGLVCGGIAQNADSAIGDNQRLRDIVDRAGGAGLVSDSFLAALTSVMGVIVAAYAVQTVLVLRAEETGQRAEPVLAGAVGRLAWVGSHLLWTVVGTAAALLGYGLTAGLAYGAGRDDLAGQLPRVVGAALAQLPAVWVLAAAALLLFGLLPRLAVLAWALPVLCLFFGPLGSVFDLDQALLDLSPFSHLPRLPGGPVTATAFVVLLVVTAALAAAGAAGARRRDLPVG